MSGLRSWPGFCWCRLSARRRSGPEEADDGVEFGGIVHGIRLGRRWRGPACPGNNEPGRTARAARRWPCAGWEWQRPFITLCISCKTCRVMASGKRGRGAFPPSCRIFGGARPVGSRAGAWPRGSAGKRKPGVAPDGCRLRVGENGCAAYCSSCRGSPFLIFSSLVL